MSQDEFTNGLLYGFESSERPREEPFVYWLDEGRTIRVRPSYGQAITRAWQTPRDRELIRQHILWLNAEGLIDHDEAYLLWNTVCDLITSRLEIVEGMIGSSDDDREPAPFMEWWFFALGLGSILCGGVFVWLFLEMWR